jgi:gluconolactonase
MRSGMPALLACCLMALAGGHEARRPFQLREEDPRFWDLLDRAAKPETVATGFGFTEGPVWDPAGFLYVSDEVTNKIFKVYRDGRKEEFASLGDPDGNTYDSDNRLIVCASVLRAIIRMDRAGRYQVLAERFAGNRFNSPNDVVVGPDGALYFTDPTLDLPPGEKQEVPFQGVYRLDPSGAVALLTREMSQPNGLAFAPDGKRLFVDDSQQRNIRVFDFTPEHTLANGRVFASEPGGKGEGVPDGMKFDRAGNLYVTGPGGIWIWDQRGRHLGTIVMPEQPANLAWGDPDYGTLYITATTSLYRLRTKAHGFIPYLEGERKKRDAD